jgi:hypothetical protein
MMSKRAVRLYPAYPCKTGNMYQNEYMSENIEFGSQHEAIYTLKNAVRTLLLRQVAWPSSDGQFVYMAQSPLDPEIDPITFSNMDWLDAKEVMNTWYIKRINLGRLGVDATLVSTQYKATPYLPLVAVEWGTPATLYDEAVTDPLAEIEERQNCIAAFDSPPPAIVQDFANLDNAIFDLNIHTKTIEEIYRLERSLMTPEDIFRDRELRRQWLIEPEPNQTGGPLWWNISTMSALFVIYAHTAEEAIQAVEDKYYDGHTLLDCQIGQYSEALQQRYEKFIGRKIVRLLRFSTDEFTTSTPEIKNSIPDDPLDLLFALLDVQETSEPKNLANLVLDLLQDEHSTKAVVLQAWRQYDTAIETMIETAPNSPSRAKLQIAAIIFKAIIFRAAEDTFRYVEELQDASTYALNQDLDDISGMISQEIDFILAAYDDQPPEYIILTLRSHLSYDNYEMLRDSLLDGSDRNDILGAVYGMLLDQGDDPDQVLNSLDITKS